MSQRLMSLLAVVVMVALVLPVVPASAQSEIPAPAACTAEEQQQIADWIQSFSEQYGAASQVVAEPATAGEFTTEALALNDVLRMVEDDDTLPYCTDVLVAAPMAELMVAHQLLMMQLSAAYFYASDAGVDTETLDALMGYFTFHQEKTLEYQDAFIQVAEPLAAGTPLVTEWLPACTDEDNANESAVQLVELESALDDQSDAIATFLTDGTIDLATIFALEDTLAAWETLTETAPTCHEVYMRSSIFASIQFELATSMYWSTLEGAEAEFTDAITAAREAASADVIESATIFEGLFPSAVTE